MFLIKLNFVTFLTALNVLADGSEKTEDPQPYLSLRENSSGPLYNVVFRGANIVNPDDGVRIYRSDIAVNMERRRASFTAPNYVREIGDLGNSVGLEEYLANGFNVIHRYGNTKIGELAEFFFYKRDRQVDWTSKELEKQFPPDAIFSTGKWTKGEGVVPKK
jgi:hypothetical protein